MPAPETYEWSAAAIIAAHTAVRDLIDAHATLPGAVLVRDAADVLLGTITLTDPCGTVNGTTGQLAFDFDGREDDADAGGTIAYVEFVDGDGTVHLALPAEAGTEAVSGKAVFNTLTVVAGAPIEMVAAVVG
ncbi:hypothetical protein [Pseudazoarcus pumilus]|uniref:Uncharacterized protein n=1 Tax=Pseudazoarcus pumilus TaxID=2067960 RepID=A0A2I6S864_9RHOO|nr:hypothetical protein [Pseudazoarcus pumilus]AUN95401.1 hypothetical protein C0099_10965 [Pseudazoarcus pumilus]